jgi:Zn-dependent protease with chaperone function
MSTPRTGDYLISKRELAPGWLMLYALTFALQLPCASIRGLVSYPVLWVALKVLGQSTSDIHTFALILAYGPLALSLATLILPLGGWWWEQREGGRTPSEREQLIYDDAITQLTQANPGLRSPRRWFVLDEDEIGAAAYADTLMITRGLLDSGYLEAVIAHELGHLNSSDSRLTAAVHRITTPPRRNVRPGLKTIMFFATGAAGMWPLRAMWGAYWRAREHQADQYAANLGQAPALSQFLDVYALQDDLPVPFIWLTEQSHPPAEHRIDRLYHADTA